MALTYTPVTYGGQDIEVYELDTDAFIVKGFLDSRDEKTIEDAVAGDGVATTEMPNGRGTVLEYYSALARSADELETQYTRYQFASRPFEVITDPQTDVADLESTITDLQTDVSGLQTSVSGQESTITDLQTSVAGQESTITDLQTSVSDQETAITDLQTSVSDQETAITG